MGAGLGGTQLQLLYFRGREKDQEFEASLVSILNPRQAGATSVSVRTQFSVWLCLSLYLSFSNICGYFVLLYICVPHLCLEPTEAREGFSS